MSDRIDFTLYSHPGAIPELVSLLTSHPRIFIDTEVADWASENPKLSLIQITTGGGKVHIIDVLASGVKQAVESLFVSGIMQNPNVEKWAHNSAFDRRFLGGHLVHSLYCTLQLARSIPYHRLPLRSLSLGSLVNHFFKEEVDKSTDTRRAATGH